MRLGLVGRGPQAERYASLRNGGQNISARVDGHVSASAYRTFLDSVDAVIIATHPAGHRDLAMIAIESGTPLLIEKPLALNRADCEEILTTAERYRVPVEVAHTRLWSRQWHPSGVGEAYVVIEHKKHERDYSVWLDWAPHAIAALADAMPAATERKLRSHVSIAEGMRNSFSVWGDGWSYYTMPGDEAVPPMLLMVADFIDKLHLSLKDAPLYWKKRYDFNRRVYRALFAGENNATT